MFKRFWWIFLATTGLGTLIWLASSKVEPKKKVAGSISSLENPADWSATRNSDSPGAEHDKEMNRESSRHSAGEIERHRAEQQRLPHLEEAVRRQEEKVEERRKVLATIVRTKGIIYKGSDSYYKGSDQSTGVETHEAAAKKSLDAQDYADAKRDFETDWKLLQKMKLNLLKEQIQAKQGGR